MRALLQPGMMVRVHPATAAFALALVSAQLTGCSVPGSLPAANERGVTLQGQVSSGQQAVSGSSIALYAAGSSGAGSGAVNLLGAHIVSSDSSGSFDIAGDYVCPTATTQVYLVARGGNPGLSSNVNNHALTMMAALGDCASVQSSTRITVNERTTVASAWALSQFLGPDASVGASPTNSAGLNHAFATARELVETTTGSAPGSDLPAGAITETAKLNTLANGLASCVHSDGGGACSPLFAAATVTGASVPANTLDAALNIVRHPAGNVSNVFSVAGAGGPFQPGLNTPPNDWTMSITYSGGGLNIPGQIAVDSTGNVLIANYFGGVVSKFSPTGIAMPASGIAGTGLKQSYGIAIDGFDNVWVTNEQSVTNANNHRNGSVSEFSRDGLEISGPGYIGGGLYYPVAVAADANGNIWVADHSSSAATLLANSGAPLSGSSGFGASALPFPSAVAIDGSHNAWFAIQGGVARVSPSGAVDSFSCCRNPAGLAIDAAGNLWVTEYAGSAILELSANGSLLRQTTLSSGKAGPQGIAIDGDGNVWAANYYGNSVAELSGATAAVLSPDAGYGLDAALSEPYGLAIDAGGNIWLSNTGANSVTQLIGLAAPIRTPLLQPPVRP